MTPQKIVLKIDLYLDIDASFSDDFKTRCLPDLAFPAPVCGKLSGFPPKLFRQVLICSNATSTSCCDPLFSRICFP